MTRVEKAEQLPDIKDLVKEPATSLTESRNHYVRSWATIAVRLPNDLTPGQEKFVKGYFRAQLRLAQGKPTKAGRIFKGLESNQDYSGFEEENQDLLAAIDLAVRGETRWDVEPAFRIKDEEEKED